MRQLRSFSICYIGIIRLYQYTQLVALLFANSYYFYSRALVSRERERYMIIMWMYNWILCDVYRCSHDDLQGLSAESLRSIYANVSHPSCTLLDGVINGTAIEADGMTCENWIFERESGYESITTELQWVCDKSHQAAVGQSFFFIGSVVGTITFGYLSDRIGRLPCMIMATLAGASGDFMTSFVYTLPWFAFSRFVSGLSTDTMYYLMYILGELFKLQIGIFFIFIVLDIP